MRRIEKKYRHKNNLNSQENKLMDKYSDRRNNNNENLERRGSQKHKNVHHKKSENYFSKTQNLGFNNTHSKLTSKPTTLDFINTSETEYNHNGHAYLDKMNQDEEKRVKKLHGEMQAFNDKINDLQKGANSHHRETFYSCLENKIKEKIQGLGNSGTKFENVSKISNLNNFPEPNEYNILNTSSAFNKTKSQFRATVTGCDILSPINEGQQPNRYFGGSRAGDDLIKIDENRNFETTRVFQMVNTNYGALGGPGKGKGMDDVYESRDNPFRKTKRAESINPENSSVLREESRDTKLISLKNSQVMSKIKDEYSMKGQKNYQRFKPRLNSKLSLKV